MSTTIILDISDLVRTRSSTGIQRVLKEFLLRAIRGREEVTYKVVFFNPEHNRLELLPNKEVLSLLSNIRTYKITQTSQVKLSEVSDSEYTLFVDMDSTWNSFIPRTELYPRLKEQGILIVNLIYDLIPCICPEFIHEETVRKFLKYISAVYRFSDLVLLDSRSSENDFISLKERAGCDRHIPTSVIPLGSDFTASELDITIPKSLKYILKQKYLLFVGTLEPRKRHDTLIEAFEVLSDKYPELHLVLIGKRGWKVDDLVYKLYNHELINKRIFWIDNASDQDLHVFYQNAFMVTYLSDYEGYGLPIAESLNYGNVTLASSNSSLYEVGENSTDYANLGSVNEVVELISLYLESNSLYQHKKTYILENYYPKKWQLMYDSLASIFNNIENSIKSKEKRLRIGSLQAVFISIDCLKIQDTIQLIDKYMPFITEYVIVTSTDQVKSFRDNITSKNKIYIINELHILGEYQNDFHHRDHQSKNWLLRASLLNLDLLEEQFVMLDDDNRPLTPIDLDYYISREGHYNCFYYNDLPRWNATESAYDKGQISTGKILNRKGYERLSYSSHKPQIIDKQIFKEAVTEFFDLGLEHPLDEWSIYFNYGVTHYPFLFHKKIAETLNWPASPSDWQTGYYPKKYCFENYYEHLYKGGPYADYDALTSEKKIAMKHAELQPYIKTSEETRRMNNVCRQLDMVHGVLQFVNSEVQLYLFSIPYILTAVSGAWLTLKLHYKIIYRTEHSPQTVLYYLINNQEGYKSVLPARAEQKKYHEGIIDFKILSKELKEGSYSILFDAETDGKKIYGEKSPYMSKLIMTAL